MNLPGVPRAIRSAAIETTKLCNAHCVVCPREALDPELRTTMSVEDFKLATDRLHEFFTVGELTLSGFGDAAVDRHFIERLRWLKHEFGWRSDSVVTATNGAPFSTTALDAIFGENLLSTLTWSLFADDRATYLATNQRDQFDRAVAALDYAVDAKSRLGSFVAIRLYTLLLEQNKDTFRRILDRWHGRVDVIEAWLPHNWSDKRTYRRNAFGLRPPACSRVTDFDFVIRSNGDVTACCLDINHTLSYGNILRHSLHEIFAPDTFYWKLRAEHEAGFVLPGSLCDNCDFLNNRSTTSRIYLEEQGEVRLDLVTGRSIAEMLASNTGRQAGAS